MLFTINNYSKLFLVCVHIILGFFYIIPFFSKGFTILLFIVGLFYVIKNKNVNEEALLFSAYLTGYEVFMRMTKGFLLYETGKYGVLLFLVVGFFSGKNTNKPNVSFVIYLLLLLIGIAFTTVPEGESIRKAVAFNLSGPFLLGLIAIYCYRRKITFSTIYNILFVMLLPIIAMSSYLFFRTPDLSEIVFGGSANFSTSGGFGPNQVSTVLGLGVFIVAVFLLTKRKLSGFILVDLALLFYLFYRGLLTFSRGGMLTGFIALLFFVLLYALGNRDSIALLMKVVGVGFVLVVSAWIYTSGVTGGVLNNRYLGQNAKGEQKEDISSGRVAILEEQLQGFYENPIFGIGVGNGKYKREEGLKGIVIASHNEVGRLIEEHGLIGVFSLLLLILTPLFLFFNQNYLQNSFLIAFVVFWFLTSSHSGMRIAFPSFIYGLSLIQLVKDEE